MDKMKKMLFTAMMLLFAAYNLFAADAFVKIGSLESDGCKVSYDWSMDRFAITGAGGTVYMVINYPFVVSDKKTVRTDFSPYTESGYLYISAMTADKIKSLVSAGTQKEPAAEQVIKPVQAVTALAPKPTAAVKQTEVMKEEAVTAEESKPVTTIKKASGRKLIVLDPGHGGNDPGAIGFEGLNEKDVVLRVAQRVKDYLKPYNADVLLTRNTDEFITLKNRAIFANSRKADLFVSIHCNASNNRTASGTRSYIYNRVASSKEAAEAAKFENKNTGAFDFIMNDLRKSAYEYLSIELAGNIQRDLINGLKLKWLPTERAPFYVIANTNMPSVLVEIAFISNPNEENKLKTNEFKDKVANNIALGITQYMEKVK
jgi:N-acetylmuramoyl-L-alanine amidase